MNIIFLIAIIPFSVITFMIINKDFYNGRSIGKRVFGYQVVDIKTNSVASEIQCMARNLTLLIWPLEILIVLINPSRRLGDIIAGTKVIEKEQVAPESILVEINEFKNGRNNSKVIVISIICTTLIEALSILPLLLTN